MGCFLRWIRTVQDDFQRINRLPTYVFKITDALKREARAKGEDIIDFGMGNPDQPTPKHIVDKLVETAQRQDTHRYSMSRGIPRLRKAISNWYKRRFDVDIDPETEAIVVLSRVSGEPCNPAGRQNTFIRLRSITII